MMRMLAAALLAAMVLGPARAAEPLLDIQIEAAKSGAWSVTYALPAPARTLAFPRSPDDSRTRTWGAPAAFEIVSDAEGERVRRRDGAPFRTVTLSVPPVYQVLPKDYAPFSPFGDGGVLVYTGRFFACPDACPDDPAWRFRLRAKGRGVLLNGRRSQGRASWVDRGDGRNLYVGETRPIAGEHVAAVIDQTLPAPIRARLEADLPRFMDYFADRFGALEAPPMLFISYDLSHPKRWGRQGGVLPGQVFVHFYGAAWPEQMAKPGFEFDLSWHFAHEAAHLYQRGLVVEGDAGAWVHEGAADAFAAIALRDADAALWPAIDAKIADSRAACTEATKDKPLAAVIEGSAFEAAYSCGLVLHLALHEAALARDASGEGLVALWRAFAANAADVRPVTLASFEAAVADVAGPCMAERLRASLAAAPLVAPEPCSG